MYDHEHSCPTIDSCIRGVDCCICWKAYGIVIRMEDDTEPMFLTFKTYEVAGNRTLTSDSNVKDVVHALRPMEGATDIWNDPCTLACDNDEIVYGNRNKRSVNRANTITCPRCLIAISLA